MVVVVLVSEKFLVTQWTDRGRSGDLSMCQELFGFDEIRAVSTPTGGAPFTHAAMILKIVTIVTLIVTNDFCRLDYWLISNTLHDLVKTTHIIPCIKTDHAAISLDLVNDSNDIKGPGLWKINCSLLDDKDYVNDITEKIPIWLAEGRKDSSDNRSIWDWLKYNMRAHTIQLSKRKARERNEREQNLEEEYAKAKFIFELTLVTEMQILLIGLKIHWNCFMKKKSKE